MKEPELSEGGGRRSSLSPLIAYRHPRNLRDMLVRAKLPTRKHQRPRCEAVGMKKGKNCPNCPLVKTGNKIRSTSSNYVHEVRGKFDCQTENICYVVSCKKKGCGLQYIGESKHTAQHRWSQHRGYVTGPGTQATGEHFNSRGHSLADMEFSVLETFKKGSHHLRKEREKYYINKFNTKHKGLNNKKSG